LKRLGHEPVVLAARSPRPSLEVEQTSDWQGAVARKDVDAVVIAFPPPLQQEAVLAVAALGKPFICEKPAGMNPAETSALAAAAEKSRLPHAVGYQFRYEPAFRELKRLISAGEIGDIERVEIDWCVGGQPSRARAWSWRNDASLGGGVPLNFATHALDYLRWFCGEASLLGGTSQTLVGERKDDNGAPHGVTAPDTCDFLLRFGSSAIASVRVSNVALAATGHRVIARGSRGTVELWHRPPFCETDMTLTVVQPGGHSQQQSGTELGMAAGVTDSRIGPTCGLISDFVAAVSGDSVPHMPTLHDALAVQQLLVWAA
jgi:myo-inositol 2-dehydrogenase/D-chiro-inositol 1-dehydrogenase